MNLDTLLRDEFLVVLNTISAKSLVGAMRGNDVVRDGSETLNLNSYLLCFKQSNGEHTHHDLLP